MSKKFNLGIVLMLALVFIIAGCSKENKNPVAPLETTNTSIDCWTPCVSLVVCKTAAGSCEKTLNWEITKTADPTSAELCVNDAQVINYTITVKQVGATEKCKVSGTITIKNTSWTTATTVVKVEDEIFAQVGWYWKSVTKVLVKDEFIIGAGKTETIPYEIEFVPPAGYTKLKNVAYVTQKYGYGTKLYTSTPVYFTLTKTLVNNCVDVNDSYAGFLGQVCGEGASKTFTYSRSVSYSAPGTYYVENTATADGKSASTTVTIVVKECGGGGGCTYTQGYWKNHEEAWPVSNLTLGTVNYTKAQLLQIFDQEVGGNGLISLAHQLIAAKLNIANGADPSAVSTTIAAADALIGALVVPPIGTGYLAPSATDGLTTILDNYNNGYIGPGHCD